MSLQETPKRRYSEEDIQVLEPIEAVRRRPGMYVDVHGTGALTLAAVFVADALERTGTQRAITVDVTLHSDGSISVVHDGTPPSALPHMPREMPALQHWLTRFSFEAPMGTVANALSETLEVAIHEHGVRRVQRYARGRALTPLTPAGATNRTGIAVHFRPDRTVFSAAPPSLHAFAGHLRSLAVLDPRADIRLEDRATGAAARLRYPNGLRDFVEEGDDGQPGLLAPTFHVIASPAVRRAYATSDDARVELAARFRDGGRTRSYGFIHGGYRWTRYVPDRGSHVTGFLRALDRVVARIAGARGTELARRATRRWHGVTVAVAIDSQRDQLLTSDGTKIRSSIALDLVARAAEPALEAFLAAHPELAARLVAHATRANAAGT